MFSQPSDARSTLDTWVRELLGLITPPGPDADLIGEITVCELLDLCYVQGAALDSSVAAHAIFPQYVERSDRTAGPSAMIVSFPILVTEDGRLQVSVRVRWGQGCALQIGEGGRNRIVTPHNPLADLMKRPRIGGTAHDLGEPNGARLRVIAGPMRVFEHVKDIRIDRAEGEFEEALVSPAADTLYAFVDNAGAVTAKQDDAGALFGEPVDPATLPGYRTYLWAETRPARVLLRVTWSRKSADRVLVTVSLRNVTEARDGDRANATLLGALLMPHLWVGVRGGEPEFPAQQYAEAKRAFLALADDDDRSREASRRLYSVRQSGCIATHCVGDRTQVIVTTFGAFDTPREPPVVGPRVADIVTSPEAFVGNMTRRPSAQIEALVRGRWEILRAVVSAAADAFNMERLYRFQWEAIQANLEFVATGATRPVTVVRAPTGAGKTIVFMIDAALSALCGPAPGTAVLMFPTRLLNEDMFRRLTAFVFALRQHTATSAITGGLLMGTSDPLYRVLLAPEPGEAMHHFGTCPACGAEPPLVAVAEGGRMIPECKRCGHKVGYMYTTYDVATFLPDIVIATPDKLLYEATAQAHEYYRMGMFGASVRRCRTCGRACPEAYLALKPEAIRCRVFHKGADCPGVDRGPAEIRPIRYIGFDEVHSLYGVTATYLSMFLADLEALQVFLSQRRDVGIRYEAATATISNETELLEALTRRRAAAGEIIPIPPTGQESDYFDIAVSSVRHRVVVSLPTRATSRQAFLRSTLNAYRHLRGAGGELEASLAARTPHSRDWHFLLGYLFRKQEGTDMRRALRDMYRNAFGQDLSVEFLSGEAPKDQISHILERALRGEIEILLANLVISLGVDIHGLNHMIMMGVPQGFTEFVQTAGRTGRGRSSGHVHIVLQPFNPRDAYLYRHFHAVLTDVAGYYDVLPVKSTNLFCAGEMFGNVAKSVLTALCMTPQQPRWPHAGGIQAVLAGRERQIQSGLARILCDDPDLLGDTEELVRTKLRALLDELSARGDFLSNVMMAPGSDWLIRSLRGKSGSVVRVTCADDALLERLRSPAGRAAARRVGGDGAPEGDGAVEPSGDG